MISTQYISRVALVHEKVDSFEVYPFSIPSIRSLDKLELHPKVTFFIGENGAGKSTLLEAIAVSMGIGVNNFGYAYRLSNFLTGNVVPRTRLYEFPASG
nr:AAA family ATPase [Pectobacterium brasiliense]